MPTRLILATDPDREGEAISWHVQEVLRQKKALPGEVERVTFNAITKSAVTEAMKHPRGLDEDLIDAYRARRALDYLVGFTLSPVLWRKLPGAKSAGRVQSVALRLIVDREREIEVFRAQEYWSVSATFEADGRDSPRGWSARRRQDRPADDRQRGRRRRGEGGGRGGPVHRRVGRDQAVHAQPAAALHHLDAAAGGGAQARLFRQPHDARRAGALRGRAITYMRTDGVQMAPEAICAARRAIATRYDAGYVPDKPRQYQTKAKNAQEAHEAIRPTDFDRDRAGSGDHAPALRAGLEARAGEPDGLGAARADDGRAGRRGGAGGAARDRPGRALPRLPRALRGGPRR